MNDRVTFNDPDTWTGPRFALGSVDEIVLSDATAHLEMTTDQSAYLHIANSDRDVFCRVRARPTTRMERRELLTHSGDRLLDKLRSLLPGSGSILFTTWWRRPVGIWREWRDARREARAVLLIHVEDDNHV